MIDESHPAIRARTSWPVDNTVREVVTSHGLIVGRFEVIGELVQDKWDLGRIGMVVWDHSVSETALKTNSSHDLLAHPYN